MFTVQKLIEALSDYDPTAVVTLPHPDYGRDVLHRIESIACSFKARPCGDEFVEDYEYGRDKIVILE